MLGLATRFYTEDTEFQNFLDVNVDARKQVLRALEALPARGSFVERLIERLKLMPSEDDGEFHQTPRT